MIISFSFENYLSFKKKTKINFEAGFIREFKSSNLIDFHDLNFDLRILKSLGLYGYNASGKSNVLKAFSFMQEFVTKTGTQPIQSDIEISQFKLSSRTEPNSLFEIELLLNKSIYRYGFKLNKTSIEEEWLFVKNKSKETNLFTRIPKNGDIRLDKKFRDWDNKRVDMISKLVPNKSLFLTQLSQFEEPNAVEITRWFTSCLVIQGSVIEELIDITAKKYNEFIYKSKIHEFLTKAEIGFSSVESVAMEDTKRTSTGLKLLNFMNESELPRYDVKTKHIIYDDMGNIKGELHFKLKNEESSGSQKFFGLLGPIVSALLDKKFILIDEIDSKFHSNLLTFIINLFNSSVQNPLGAQLLYVSHNASPLNKKMRRDQVLLVAKNKEGVSSLSRLYDDKEIRTRHDASMENQYKEGGMIPFPKPEVE